MRGVGVVFSGGQERDGLLPYVPRLLLGWNGVDQDDRHSLVRGTVVFVDISGFTRLTERLARKGKLGAEELSDLLSSTFGELLTEAYADGGDLVKWGGDAMLLLFRDDGHAVRAARSAHRMRSRLNVVGRLATSGGVVTLRMSVGIHSGDFDFFLVGDPTLHRELLISGPAATTTADVEAAAGPGQIALSAATAALLDQRSLGAPVSGGRLLRTAPPRVDPPTPQAAAAAGGPSAAQVLSPPIRSLLLSGAVEAEHRLITVAFVQYSGTDQLLSSLGAVGLTQALDEVVRSVQHACASHDVTFFESDINADGGKIMLTAGAPSSAEHDEERLLRVARVVLDRAGQLPLRIGITRGHVFSGDFGSSFRRTYSVKGDAINLAARLLSKAVPGQALATLEVLERSRTVFRTTELPPFMVKGKAEPVRAADVGALLGARAEARPSSQMIGRAREMAALEEAASAAQQGRGRLVEVTGEAGLGKSRLVREGLSGQADLHVVFAPCEQYDSSTPYFPFRRLLRDVLEIPSSARPEQVADLLRQRVAATSPDLLPWLPLVGLPMDLHLPPTQQTAELDAGFRKEQLERVVVELLGSVVSTPTALVIEDADFMDEASSDLLRRLGDQLDGLPLLVVVTRREGSTTLASSTGPVITVALDPLAPQAALEFVHAVPIERPLTPQVASQIVDRGGGNPMFLEALVLETSRTGTSGWLPESVQALVASQIDRLDPADRTVVRYAAVFGTVVDEPVLDLLLRQHQAQVPDGAMRRLADFLERDAQGHLRFRNALIRDVAYEALPFSRRKTLHEHVGEALERATTDSPIELLSLHFFHAGRHDQAWQYSVQAGERALAKYAHGEAIEFFARATQSAPYRTIRDPVELARIYERLADSRWVVGLTQEAAEAYSSARGCLRGDPVRLAGIIEKEARIDQRRRRHSTALRRISLGLNNLKDVPGSGAGVARSLLERRYAQSRFIQGRVAEALRWADAAAEEAEEAADKDALAQAYEMLNFIYASSGRDEPLPYGRLALQAYVELGNLARQGHCLNNLAMQEYTRGRWDDSLIHLRQASDIFHRIGDTAAEANALYNQVELLVRQRRPAEAQEPLPEVLRIARAVEDKELVGLALREQGRSAALSGETDGATALLDQARAMFAELDEPGEVRITDIARAEVLLESGRLEEAGQTLVSLTESTESPEPIVRRLLGRQHLAQERFAEGRVVVEQSLVEAERAGDRYEQGLLLLTLAELTRREGSSADPLNRRARDLLVAMGVQTPEEGEHPSG